MTHLTLDKSYFFTIIAFKRCLRMKWRNIANDGKMAYENYPCNQSQSYEKRTSLKLFISFCPRK